MERKKVGASASEMLGNLKSRLGFAHNENEDEEFARYDADFDDYDDMNGVYGERYEEYESYSETSDPSTTGGFRAISTRSGRFGRPDSTPNLVSIEDVREHSKSLMNGMGGSRSSSRERYGSRRTSSRSTIEASGPAPSSPAYTAAQRESSLRSEGLNSLFESTSSGHQERYASTSVLDDSRVLTVIKPYAYNDVEGVARALKAGDAVVLAMGETDDELFKRILDFSFGVASALDASVDCLASRVYAIACGPGLSEDEKSRLSAQGVL